MSRPAKFDVSQALQVVGGLDLAKITSKAQGQKHLQVLTEVLTMTASQHTGMPKSQ
jgi:hypothetical protein